VGRGRRGAGGVSYHHAERVRTSLLPRRNKNAVLLRRTQVAGALYI